MFDELFRHRIILVDREVDDELANQVTAQLLLLANEGTSADVTLYIDSPGGSITAGTAIIDTMRYVACDVATCAIGLAAGMGQCLLTAGAKGKRFAVPPARILMREPTAPAPVTPVKDRMLERTRRVLAEMLAEDTGQTAERILADWGPDCWFTAQEVRAYGLVDRVGLPELYGG